LLISAEKENNVDKWSKKAALVATVATIFSAYNAVKVSSLETDLKNEY
jgi:hypothetical protein